MSHSIDCMLCRKTIHDPDAQGQLTLRSEGRTSYLCAACNEVRESPIRWGYIWCAVADELGRLRDETGALTRERDEARAEAAKWKAGFEEFRSRNTDLMMQLFEAQEKVRAVNIEPMLHLNAQLRSKVHGLSAEVERLTSELQRERIGIRPVDEVRSDAYRRGAEAMREACAAEVEHNMTRGLMTAADITNVLRTIRNAIPIPEEP